MTLFILNVFAAVINISNVTTMLLSNTGSPFLFWASVFFAIGNATIAVLKVKNG